MRLVVFGAGAIGGLVAARLARAGVEVGLVARGAALDAIGRHGLTVVSGADRFTVSLPVTGDPSSLAPPDAVLLCLKGHAIPAALEQIAALAGPSTAMVPVVNGIPYWYGARRPGGGPDQPVEAVDPGGRVLDRLGAASAVGCVTHASAAMSGPAEVLHNANHAVGDAFFFGEPDGDSSPRVEALAQAFRAAGFKAEATPRIRMEVWRKLTGNAAFNPLSAVTGGTFVDLCRDPATRAVCVTMVNEALAVASAQGEAVAMTAEKRVELAETLGAFKSSMLQDWEKGRAIELEPLLGAVIELAHTTGVAVPTLETIYAVARFRARTLGLYLEASP